MSDQDDGQFRGAPSVKPRETEAERAQGGAYPSELDNRRDSGEDGQPPRSATEPMGSEGSSLPDPEAQSDTRTARETQSDPITGAPIRPADPENNQA